MCCATDDALDVPALSGSAFCELCAVAAVDGGGLLMVVLAEKIKWRLDSAQRGKTAPTLPSSMSGGKGHSVPMEGITSFV